MARRVYDEDLFESTKMTFGEHLEELRKCFFKAGIGLAIGMIVGLYFASDIVRFIQTPLTDALKEHYREQAQKKLEIYAAEQMGGKENIPPEVLARLFKGDDIFEMVYWDTGEIKRRLGLSAPPPPTPPNIPEDAKEEDRRKILREWEQPQLQHVLLWRKATEDPRITIKSLSADETFMIWLKAGFVFGAIVSSPWVFVQVWNFVAAGLYPHERSYVYIFLPFSLSLFLAGAALAFFLVFSFVLRFLFSFNAAMGIDPDPRISEWLSFVILMPLGFGISFQLPLIMLFLHRIGLFTVEAYLSKWRIAVLVMACLSAVLSPGGDPYSMLFMFLPLVGLFFLGIGLCRFMPKAENPFNEATG